MYKTGKPGGSVDNKTQAANCRLGGIMRFQTVRLLACVVALLALSACGGGHGRGSTTPTTVVYDPSLRNSDLTNTNRYYQSGYYSYGSRSISNLWESRYPDSDATFLTPLGRHREELRSSGMSWLSNYPDAHISAAAGTLAVPPGGTLFSSGLATVDTTSGALILDGSGTNLSYVVYALKDIPADYRITNIQLFGDWDYVSADAIGGLRIGTSLYDEDAGYFVNYSLGGDLYYPGHWCYTARSGIKPASNGTAYILVAVHGGVSARLDGITVTLAHESNLPVYASN